jgi:hypothetical protein
LDQWIKFRRSLILGFEPISPEGTPTDSHSLMKASPNDGFQADIQARLGSRSTPVPPTTQSPW